MHGPIQARINHNDPVFSQGDILRMAYLVYLPIGHAQAKRLKGLPTEPFANGFHVHRVILLREKRFARRRRKVVGSLWQKQTLRMKAFTPPKTSDPVDLFQNHIIDRLADALNFHVPAAEMFAYRASMTVNHGYRFSSMSSPSK